MLIEIQKRKCLRCGHTFSHALGGIVFNPTPRCPKCDSIFTIRIKRLL